MSTLSSSSTDAEVWAAYDDNASYEEDASITKARAFITACRIILRRNPKQTTRAGGLGLVLSPELIRADMQAAQTWLVVHDTSDNPNPGAVQFGFAEFRR